MEFIFQIKWSFFIMKNNLERGLIIDSPYIDLILSGDKIWEMRTKKTKIRGKIGLIKKGSGLIFGECEIVDSLEEITLEEAECLKNFHAVEDVSLLGKWKYPWVIRNVIKYENPIKYNHPRGAVIWVNF